MHAQVLSGQSRDLTTAFTEGTLKWTDPLLNGRQRVTCTVSEFGELIARVPGMAAVLALEVFEPADREFPSSCAL